MKRVAFKSFLLILVLVAGSLAIGFFRTAHNEEPLSEYTSPQEKKQPFIVKAEAKANMIYKQEMIALIQKISTYAKHRNPVFQLIGNNGVELFQSENVGNEALDTLLRSVDGIIMEGYHYGWEMHDDMRTPLSFRSEVYRGLEVPLKLKLPILNIDYCYTPRNIDRAYQLNDQSGFVGFAADSRQLDTIPAQPQRLHRENSNSVQNLRQVQNFLVLFNPHAFTDKQKYLESLKNTNYDLLIIDMYFDGDPLTPEDVALLKVKKNGAVRLVYSYMSVGEAEDYRSYWKNEWSQKVPAWVAEVNPDWPGNYKVRYWSPEWQNILFGSADAYLDKIMDTGFDGIFMDVIDAFEYFEEKN